MCVMCGISMAKKVDLSDDERAYLKHLIHGDAITAEDANLQNLPWLSQWLNDNWLILV